MSATIEFLDAPNAEPRQFICNVWPLKGGDIGDATVLNQPVSAKSSRSTAPSRLILDEAGDYLVELVHPGGRRTQRALKLEDSSVVKFELPQTLATAKSHSLSHAHVKKRPARVLASGADSFERHQGDEILAVPAPRTAAGSLGNLRAFLAGILACRHKGVVVGRITSDPVVLEGAIPSPQSFEWSETKVWLLVRGASEAMSLLAYPSGWQASEDMPMKIVASRCGSEDALRVSLKLLDPARASLLEFLSNRDWESAWATYLATDDLVDPVGYSKVISAYARALAGEERADDGQLLSDAFEAHASQGFPDLAISLAWQCLRDAEVGSPEFIQARKWALSAIERGFPLFTLGLRVLADALNYISSASPHDREVKLALGAVTRAVMVSVPGEIFTTIDVSRLLALSVKDKASGDQNA